MANEANPLVAMTVEKNQRNNKACGDVLDREPSATFRTFGVNVNGITIDKRGGQMDTLCQIQIETQTDVMCGQEHKLDTTQTEVRSVLQQTIRRHWPKARGTFATTPITFNNFYKPGGTFILTTGQTAGRIIRQDRDKWGRWSTHTLRGKVTFRVTIISTYQVVHKFQNGTVGTITADAQQRSLIAGEETISHPARGDSRFAFKRDLQEYIQECRARQEEIILLGDFNECIGFDPSGMAQLIATTQLIDLFQLRHTTKPPATYAQGTKQLDYAWGTSKVAASLEKCGFEPFNFRYHTDHRAYFLDFDINKLFGTDTPQQQHEYSPRGFYTNNVKQETEYIAKKHAFPLTSRNAFERAQRLQFPGNRHEFFETLDQDVQQASKAAEKHVTKFGEPAWSQALARARTKVSVLSKCKTMATTKLDHSTIIADTIQKAGIDILIPTTLKECNHALTAAKLEVKRIVKESFTHRTKEQDEEIIILEKSTDPDDKKSAKR